MAYLSKPFRRVRAAPEPVFGTAPPSGPAWGVDVWGFSPPALDQQLIELDALRPTTLLDAPRPGMEGGDGPTLDVPLVPGAAVRAFGAAPFALNDGIVALWRTALGSGVDPGDGPARAKRTGGGQIVGAAGDPVTTITVAAGQGGRFAPGGVVIARGTTGALYPLYVAAVAGDVLTVDGGPRAAALGAGGELFGTHAMPISADADDSIALDVEDVNGLHLALYGVNGDVAIEAEAGAPVKARFALNHARGAWSENDPLPGTTFAPAAARAPFTADRAAVRLAAYFEGVNSALDPVLAVSRVRIGAGVERADLIDAGAGGARAGRPVVRHKPTIELTTYFAPTFYNRLRNGTPMRFSALFGDAARGFAGVVARRVVTAGVPAVGDMRGLRTHEITLRAVDAGDGGPAFLFFFG